jgi:hypothetical protein
MTRTITTIALATALLAPTAADAAEKLWQLNTPAVGCRTLGDVQELYKINVERGLYAALAFIDKKEATFDCVKFEAGAKLWLIREWSPPAPSPVFYVCLEPQPNYSIGPDRCVWWFIVNHK